MEEPKMGRIESDWLWNVRLFIGMPLIKKKSINTKSGTLREHRDDKINISDSFLFIK